MLDLRAELDRLHQIGHERRRIGVETHAADRRVDRQQIALPADDALAADDVVDLVDDVVEGQAERSADEVAEAVGVVELQGADARQEVEREPGRDPVAEGDLDRRRGKRAVGWWSGSRRASGTPSRWRGSRASAG